MQSFALASTNQSTRSFSSSGMKFFSIAAANSSGVRNIGKPLLCGRNHVGPSLDALLVTTRAVLGVEVFWARRCFGVAAPLLLLYGLSRPGFPRGHLPTCSRGIGTS